jgi:hypothetical protein
MIDPTIEALIVTAEAGANDHTDQHLLLDDEPERSALAAAKLRDAEVAGFEPEFTPREAEAAGAFLEDALPEAEARDTGPALPRLLAVLLAPKAQLR